MSEPAGPSTDGETTDGTTTVTVRGRHEAMLPPERATVRLRVAVDGPDAAQVGGACAHAAQLVCASIAPLHAPDRGPVTWFALDQVRTSAHRPWNQDGVQLPLVHTALAQAQVKFSDVAALGTWLGHVRGIDGVAVDGIDWALTATRRAQVVAEVRRAAVLDARTRAQAYADALGLGEVRVVALAEAGMLERGLAPTGTGAVAFSRGASGGEVEVTLVPEDVTISAEVDARFVV